MIKLAELNYHYHEEYTSPTEVIDKHKLSSGFIHFIKDKVDLLLVKHLDHEGEAIIENIHYRFFKSRNKFWYIPFKTHRFLKQEKPDIVLVQGFVFVMQVIFLRWKLGKSCSIIVQHHGERPFTGIKGFLQRKADTCIDGYLFTSLDNAKEWINKNVIPDKKKCFELLSASSAFIKKDKASCKAILNISGENNFLWVGRLNNNKDPLTILTAFEKYASTDKNARLYMAYQTGELEAEVERKIDGSPSLKNAVHLVGKIEHDQLEDWYNATDHYISGSHSEGSGYALAEAMSCGCIPVVTAIPSFKKITADGKYGFLFEPGDAEGLYKKLIGIKALDREKYSREVQAYAKEHLSYKAIADQLYQICLLLYPK